VIILREDWATVVRLVALSFGEPPPSDDLVDFLLWERTPYPMGTVAQVVAQLRVHYRSPAPPVG
jgi:hypothetical protein